MEVKRCIKCDERKPLSEYYKHPKMADGHLNKCKACSKADNIANRIKKIEQYREYDRSRGRRAGQSLVYRQTKKRATSRVSHALVSGRLAKQPCQMCGSDKVHAHHDDYSRPLDVMWLCPVHHAARHKFLEVVCGE